MAGEGVKSVLDCKESVFGGELLQSLSSQGEKAGINLLACG